MGIELLLFHFHRSCDCSIRMTKIKWLNHKHKNAWTKYTYIYKQWVDTSNGLEAVAKMFQLLWNKIDVRNSKAKTFWWNSDEFQNNLELFWHESIFHIITNSFFSRFYEKKEENFSGLEWVCLQRICCYFFLPPACLAWTRYNDCKLDK